MQSQLVTLGSELHEVFFCDFVQVTGLRQQRKRLMSETEKNKEALEYMHRQVDDLIRAVSVSFCRHA